LLNFKNAKRALSVNGKRSNISLQDLLKIAEDYTVSNPKGILEQIQSLREELLELFKEHDVPKSVSDGIDVSIVELL